ncbi:MAG TPA: NAD-dependent dehydratase, partial [Pseudolysinimonas sp.]|nr:NAD-dependent dehydratase [Pseudolysinimonas sp.]
YRVNFDRVHRELPGFECRFTASDGARQLRQIFERLQMPTDIYQFRAFTRLKQLKYLQATGQVDSELYWT